MECSEPYITLAFGSQNTVLPLQKKLCALEYLPFFGSQGMAKKHLELPNGIPSADTILRLLSRMDSKKFQESFPAWTQGYFKERASKGSVTAIDASETKFLRGAKRRHIGDKKGGCMLALKENQPVICEEARGLFEEGIKPGGVMARHSDITKDHIIRILLTAWDPGRRSLAGKRKAFNL
jgi:hypothetical protein